MAGKNIGSIRTSRLRTGGCTFHKIMGRKLRGHDILPDSMSVLRCDFPARNIGQGYAYNHHAQRDPCVVSLKPSDQFRKLPKRVDSVAVECFQLLEKWGAHCY